MPGGIALLDANVFMAAREGRPAAVLLLQFASNQRSRFGVTEGVAAELLGLTGAPPPRWASTFRLPAACQPVLRDLRARHAPALSEADLEQLAALRAPGVACVVTADEQMRRVAATQTPPRGTVLRAEELPRIKALLGLTPPPAPSAADHRNPTDVVGAPRRSTRRAAPQALPGDVHDERRYGHWKGGKFYLDE